MINLNCKESKREGIYYDMPFADYLADERINSSTLKVLYNDFAARLTDYGDRTVTGDSLRFGRMAHMALLEPENIQKHSAVMPAYNLRTKDGRQKKQEFIEKVGEHNFLYSQEAETIIAMSEAIRAQKNSDTNKILHLLDSKKIATEVSVFSSSKKCRFDMLFNSIAFDYKTSVSAHPETFIRNAIKLHYDLQIAFYIDTYKEATGNELDCFAFIVQEKKPPYLFNLIEFQASGDFVQRGREKYMRALNNYTSWKESGNNGYDGNVISGDQIVYTRGYK